MAEPVRQILRRIEDFEDFVPICRSSDENNLPGTEPESLRHSTQYGRCRRPVDRPGRHGNDQRGLWTLPVHPADAGAGRARTHAYGNPERRGHGCKRATPNDCYPEGVQARRRRGRVVPHAATSDPGTV